MCNRSLKVGGFTRRHRLAMGCCGSNLALGRDQEQEGQFAAADLVAIFERSRLIAGSKFAVIDKGAVKAAQIGNRPGAALVEQAGVPPGYTGLRAALGAQVDVGDDILVGAADNQAFPVR